METQESDIRFMSLQEYIDWRAWRGLSDDETAPPYAHPVDGWILRALESAPVRNVLDKALDTFISVEMGQFLAQGIPIDQKSFPELYGIVQECARTLGIAAPHSLCGSFGGEFNAFTAGTDEYQFVFITDALLKYFSPDEAQFVIGHECGHIAARHMVYHTLVAVLLDLALPILGPIGHVVHRFAGIPLRAWSRRSEVTADRAGLLCCGDLHTAERALIRLVAGFADVDQIDVDDYLRHYREMSEYHGASGWQQIFITHPLIPKRIEALRLFARSEIYFDLRGEEPPPGTDLLSQIDLDRLTNQIVKP